MFAYHSLSVEKGLIHPYQFGTSDRPILSNRAKLRRSNEGSGRCIGVRRVETAVVICTQHAGVIQSIRSPSVAIRGRYRLTVCGDVACLTICCRCSAANSLIRIWIRDVSVNDESNLDI